MLELNLKWFFILLLNFLGLIYVLNIILFRPLVKLFTDRENAIKGSLDAAREMNRKKEEAITAMDREIKEARNKSNEIFESLRKEGMSRQKEILEGANKQAHGLIEKAKAELKGESEKARQKLRTDVEKFSDEIVKKLVEA
jgi:F-type H+-transporting ATPase subunit b